MQLHRSRFGEASKTCRDCPARTRGLCADLSPDELRILHDIKVPPRMLAAGAPLFRQSEPCDEVFNLRDGWAILYALLEDGRRQILHFALPGALIGFQPDPHAPMTCSAEALTDVTVCPLPRRVLSSLGSEMPHLAYRLAWLAVRDGTLAFDHISMLGRRSALERVAHLLVELYCRVRAHMPDAPAETLDLPLNQTHIADALGLTAVHVCRTLRRLREDGVIEFQRGRLQLMDPGKLARLADFDHNVAAPWLAATRNRQALC
jgi:CRP/FNR family transcriptional regulator